METHTVVEIIIYSVRMSCGNCIILIKRNNFTREYIHRISKPYYYSLLMFALGL